jgi:hypothetical protein
MPRLHKTSLPVDLTNAENSSAMDCSSAAPSGLPGSFDDWLTRPAEIITSEAEPDQGTFAGLMNQCAARNISRPAPKSSRH